MKTLMVGLVVAVVLLVGCGDDDDSIPVGDRTEAGRYGDITFFEREWRGATYCFAAFKSGYAGGFTVIECPR